MEAQDLVPHRQIKMLLHSILGSRWSVVPNSHELGAHTYIGLPYSA